MEYAVGVSKFGKNCKKKSAAHKNEFEVLVFGKLPETPSELHKIE